MVSNLFFSSVNQFVLINNSSFIAFFNNKVIISYRNGLGSLPFVYAVPGISKVEITSSGQFFLNIYVFVYFWKMVKYLCADGFSFELSLMELVIANKSMGIFS